MGRRRQTSSRAWGASVIAVLGIAVAFSLVTNRFSVKERPQVVIAPKVLEWNRDGSAGPKLRVNNLSPIVVPLHEHMQSTIRRGDWVVVAFAEWSINDMAVTKQFVEDVSSQGLPGYRVGLLPFRDYEEVGSWITGYGNDPATPVYAVMLDGKVYAIHSGTLDYDGVTALVHKAEVNKILGAAWELGD